MPLLIDVIIREILLRPIWDARDKTEQECIHRRTPEIARGRPQGDREIPGLPASRPDQDRGSWVVPDATGNVPLYDGGPSFNHSNHEEEDMDQPMKLKTVATDTAGQPIFEVNGIKYLYAGKTADGDRVWQAESTPAQLVFLAPDFVEMEHRTPHVQ
jgi:hypothetical protein